MKIENPGSVSIQFNTNWIEFISFLPKAHLDEVIELYKEEADSFQRSLDAINMNK